MSQRIKNVAVSSDKGVLLKNGAGTYDAMGLTITCGQFQAQPGFPKHDVTYNISFTDNDGQHQEFNDCAVVQSGAESNFSIQG